MNMYNTLSFLFLILPYCFLKLKIFSSSKRLVWWQNSQTNSKTLLFKCHLFLFIKSSQWLNSTNRSTCSNMYLNLDVIRWLSLFISTEIKQFTSVNFHGQHYRDNEHTISTSLHPDSITSKYCATCTTWKVYFVLYSDDCNNK